MHHTTRTGTRPTAVYPKRRTSLPNTEHKIYPYLLRTLKIDRPGQVYAADTTYIPMAKGFLYLVAVIDWYSPAVLRGSPTRWTRASV